VPAFLFVQTVKIMICVFRLKLKRPMYFALMLYAKYKQAQQAEFNLQHQITSGILFISLSEKISASSLLFVENSDITAPSGPA